MARQETYSCPPCCGSSSSSSGAVTPGDPIPCTCPECDGVMVEQFSVTFGTTGGLCGSCDALSNTTVVLTRDSLNVHGFGECAFVAEVNGLQLVLSWGLAGPWTFVINGNGVCDAFDLSDAYTSGDFTCAAGGTFTFSSHCGGCSEECGEFDLITIEPVAVYYCQSCCTATTLPTTLYASVTETDPCTPGFDPSYALTWDGGSWVYEGVVTFISLTCDPDGTWTLILIHDGVTFTHASEPDGGASCDPFSQTWSTLSGGGCDLDSLVITE